MLLKLGVSPKLELKTSKFLAVQLILVTGRESGQYRRWQPESPTRF